MVDPTYTYFKKRKDFGAQIMFSEVSGHIMDSIEPDLQEQKNYILRNPVHNSTQVSKSQSLNEINTFIVKCVSRGINHAEGGWPKDINVYDEEAVTRYRRRVERDDDYVQAVNNCYKRFEHSIKQNNAINLYQMYFKDMAEQKPIEKYHVSTKSIYKDLDSIPRPVSGISWTSEQNSKIVISYCDKTYPSVGTTANKNLAAYVWDVQYANIPYSILKPPSPCWQVACSPVNSNIIIGGLEDGRVCIFDIRTGKTSEEIEDCVPRCSPVELSSQHLAHRNPISSLIYINSRLNTEFFTGSTDGQCLWWDIRNLAEPIDRMIMAFQIPPGKEIGLNHAEPVSSLQFDRSFPTRFLCGTDTGLVLNVNRKGKSTSEIMSGVFHAHGGPVRAVHRSPLTSKMFITCGDWSTHIWSDEVHSSPIIPGQRNRHPINDVCWAPYKFSSYMSISGDGRFQFWDLLRKWSKPIVDVVISKFSLLKMKLHNDGTVVAIGDNKGQTHLIALSQDLILPSEGDKTTMLQVYERETKREHILENRIKEIRLKQRTEEEGADNEVTEKIVDEEAVCLKTEKLYRKMVNAEIASFGLDKDSNYFTRMKLK